MARSNTSRLNCESLEVRDVPAIVVTGTLPTAAVTAGMPPTPDGGVVTIQEVAIAPTDFVMNQAFTAPESVTRSATANDFIAVSNSGGSLTISSRDGIFVRFAGTTPGLHNVGTTLNVQGVTGLNMNLQLGGNDSVTDGTNLTATINGGSGNDTISATNTTANPLVLLLLQQPAGLDPAILQALSAAGGQKMLQGGAGNDRLNGPLLGFLSQLDGGDGNDTIVGGVGLDVLIGGSGSDILFGLGGRDYYITFDGVPDFFGNVRGDIFLADPFDLRATR